MREVNEVVSLGVDVPLAEAGTHLDAADFHAALSDGGVVVIDARNVYESRIGRFAAPGVETLCPNIRQFSDLPRWIESVLPQIAHKKVLMYCTGGVRCESASAFLRTRGDAHRDVCQLRGGIERYLDAFPSGGHWTGKELVFDPRRAVGVAGADVVGRCLRCDAAADDYAAEPRCAPVPTPPPPLPSLRRCRARRRTPLRCVRSSGAAIRRCRGAGGGRARLGGCGCSACTASDSRARRSAAASRNCGGSSAPWPI